ncbi:MAG: proline--tRNA ligase [Candidatus Bathyarchaeota archaeon]
MKTKREKWSANFSQWFHDVIDKAMIADYRYPIKGCGVWLPYGFKLREKILSIIRKLLNDSEHEEVLFPLMITSEMLRKEAEHVGSFEDQTFWITRAGGKKLDEEIALRPTSETALAPMFKLWIRSHQDLPKKIYQIVSVFRYETKATKPLIRLREVSTFKEAHTCHKSFEDATQQVDKAVDLYIQFFNNLCLPYLISKRPAWDKFAGAEYSIAFDTLLPDGRTLQIGTVHNLGQNFSKAFDISFETEDGQQDYIYQTSYGISERVVAGVIAIHGDDHGLVLPPDLAPIQVVIVPILYKGFEEEITDKSKAIEELVKKEGIRVEADFRDKLTPGSKFYEWELKGVPIRIEIGPRDIQQHNLLIVRRDTLEKKVINEDEVVEQIMLSFTDMKQDLADRALSWFNNYLHCADTVDEAKDFLNKKFGIVEVGWCGNTDCGLKAEEKIDATVLGTQFKDKKESLLQNCLICNKQAKLTMRLAKST